MKKRRQKKLYKLRTKWNTFGTWMRWNCPECGTQKLFFYDKYDTICCIGCNTWFSEKCGDLDCPFCSIRPDTPFEALFNENYQNRNSKEWNRNNYKHKVNGQTRQKRRRKLYVQMKEKKKQK